MKTLVPDKYTEIDLAEIDVLVASNVCFMTQLSENYIYQKYSTPFDCM